MTTAEAAEFLGVHRTRVRQLVREGALKAERQDTPRGPILWFLPTDLVSYQKTSAEQNAERKGKPGRPKKTGAPKPTDEGGQPS